jgi:hypothetical protein
MGRCLIVANQTLGGEALDRAVRDRISRDVRGFYIVVPRTKARDELETYKGGFGVYEGMASRSERSVRPQHATARRR